MNSTNLYLAVRSGVIVAVMDQFILQGAEVAFDDGIVIAVAFFSSCLSPVPSVAGAIDRPCWYTVLLD